MAREPHDDAEDDLGDDADALSWAGDDARGQAAPARAPRTDGTPAVVATPATAIRSNPARLLGTGLFAGIFLAYTVGWILSVQGIGSGTTDLFAEIMWQFGEFLVIISGALWFSTTTFLTRETGTGIRFAWFGLGAVLLLPWPIVWGLL